MVFPLTSVAFAMAGLRYAYLTKSEYLVDKTRRVCIGRISSQHAAAVDVTRPNTQPNGAPSSSFPRVRLPTVSPTFSGNTDGKIDSASTSGQSEGEIEPQEPVIHLDVQCQPDQLFLCVWGGGAVTLPQDEMTEEVYLAQVTLGCQIRSTSGGRLRVGDKIHLFDSFFIRYRARNEDSQCGDLGCRARGFAAPFDDIIIRVCQKQAQRRFFKSPNRIPTFQQQNYLFTHGKDGGFVRMDPDERPAPEARIGDGVGLSMREKMTRSENG